MSTIHLKGITWGHSRGITPLLATAQRYSELHPDVSITWEKRSLQHFADYPIEKLTEHYDLLVIDHPWVGCADATRCVIPLDQHLPAAYLADQAQNTVGVSYESYRYGGHLWALPIDAATPVASYRADLLAANGVAVPRTWADVLAIGHEGKLALPAIPIDVLMNFYMFCIAHGQAPFASETEVIDEATGQKALASMRELYGLLDDRCFSLNPIGVAEAMTTTDDYWYCPFAYGYSNYTREGYASRKLAYTGLVDFAAGQPLRSTLGGTGLAISASCQHLPQAVDYARMVASPLCQSTTYVVHGGQPGHRAAWTDELANSLTHNYFCDTLPTLDAAYLRPRYNGYLHFQDEAGNPVQQYLRNGGDPLQVLAELNSIYEQSLEAVKTTA